MHNVSLFKELYGSIKGKVLTLKLRDATSYFDVVSIYIFSVRDA